MEIKLDKTQVSGIILIIVGTLLLLYMLGVLRCSMVITIASVCMIIAGIVIAGYHKPIVKLFGIKNTDDNRINKS